MPTSRDDILATALAAFARDGYIGTSLQNIADAAGTSKSTVLYHFASKEALLEDALEPAFTALKNLLERTPAVVDTTQSRRDFVRDFVDLLFTHRLALHVFINQSRSLIDVPAMQKAQTLIDDMAHRFVKTQLSPEQGVRFGVALGGAAYLLVAGDEHLVNEGLVVRPILVDLLTELLDPLPTSESVKD